MKNLRTLLLIALSITVLHSCKEEVEDPRDTTPIGLIVNKVVVTDFPQEDGFYEWDNDGTGPDLYITIGGSGYERWESPVHSNALNTVSHTFTPPSPVLVYGHVYINAYDYDQGSSYDDYIDYVSSSNNDDYLQTKPDSLLLEDNYSGLSVVVYVEYVYEGL